MKPGIYENIPNAEYHLDPALSSTVLKELINNSPAHALDVKTREWDETVKLESIVHSQILEPHKMNDLYEVIGDRRTKAGKEQYAKALEEGKSPIKKDDLLQAQAINLAVLSHPSANLFHSGVNEVSIFHEDSELGVPLKIRPDALIEATNTIVDLKVISRGMSKFQIENLARTRGWDYQAAFYLYVMKQVTGKFHNFVHFFVEKESPYGIRVMQMDEDSIEGAMDKVMTGIHQYAWCLEKNEWPGYTDDIEPMHVRRFDDANE